VIHARSGAEIQRTPSGAIREVRTPAGVLIRHAPTGTRQVEIPRPGGAVVVANAAGRAGYVQRPMVSHGQALVKRTYVVDGVARPRVYRTWTAGDRVYHVYQPLRTYHPAFYAWAHASCSRPVPYRWGWRHRPWYRHYGGYFSPYAFYESPTFWLTDFLIATTLETAYLEQGAPADDPSMTYDDETGMSVEAKDAIAQEITREMDQERDARDLGGQPPLFSAAGPKVFLVSSEVMAYSGVRECLLREGDVVQLSGVPAPGSEWAEVMILSTRGGRCPRGSLVSLRTLDLQEMANHMQAIVDQGMEKLQAERGAGLAPLPPQAFGTINAPFSDDVQADPDALDELDRAVAEADRSEQEVIQGGTAGSATTITLGMTPADVEGILGRPPRTADLGPKVIYLYKDLKVTFLKGRVSDVQ
jgi:hypothetical protein